MRDWDAKLPMPSPLPHAALFIYPVLLITPPKLFLKEAG